MWARGAGIECSRIIQARKSIESVHSAQIGTLSPKVPVQTVHTPLGVYRCTVAYKQESYSSKVDASRYYVLQK